MGPKEVRFVVINSGTISSKKLNKLFKKNSIWRVINLFGRYYRKIEKYTEECALDNIKEIKDGNKNVREQFIKDNIPYIIRSVSNVLGVPIDDKNSEEYSIGLSAFNEAIDSYNHKRNNDFFKYAFLVIKSRVYDYIRSNRKHKKVVPFSHLEEYANIDQLGFIQGHTSQLERIEIRQEIIAFEESLKQFGITILDLVTSSPKHKDSRMLSIVIAKTLAEDDFMFESMMRKKQIPLKKLLQHIKVNHKTVERNRKFIIAVALILRSNLEDLKTFVNAFEGRYDYE